MKIYVWDKELGLQERKDGAYWERNMLALNFADGWYNDDIDGTSHFDGWRRVLSLQGGAINFHIPDDFDVGILRQIEPNWDGHTTHEKWLRIMNKFGIEETT